MKLRILLLLVFSATITMAAAGDSTTGVKDAVMFMINNEPGHSRKNDTAWANEIATAINKAASANKHDPYLLVSMAHWESRFRTDVLTGKKKGPAGEIGILQCGKLCKANCPYFMDTIEGQAMCGALWLAEARKTCFNSIEETMTYYADGTVCKASDLEDKDEARKLQAKVNRRLRLAERLRNRFQ